MLFSVYLGLVVLGTEARLDARARGQLLGASSFAALLQLAIFPAGAAFLWAALLWVAQHTALVDWVLLLWPQLLPPPRGQHPEGCRVWFSRLRSLFASDKQRSGENEALIPPDSP